MPSELDKNLRRAVSKTDINKLLEIIKSPSMDSFPKDLQDIVKKLGKPIKKEMGGEVMDMTKAQPVGMMDGGKVKKMNMGGVIGGRGGKFKGMR
tara:strand:- start:288 stop:569 length:282 start_codon:yes stop_codon:yes gene_type:complete